MQLKSATYGRQSVWRHAAGLAYVAAAGVLVTRLGSKIEPRSYFGDFYPVLTYYPFFFWMLTVLYAAVAALGSKLSLQRFAANTLAIGMMVHLNFLAIWLISDDTTIARLASAAFIYYTRGLLLAIIVSANAGAFWCAARVWRGAMPPLWTATAYLPVVSLAVGPLRWMVPSIIVAAMVGLSGSRVVFWVEHQRLWPTAKRFAMDPRVFAGLVFLLAFAMRMPAAMRLAGMGRETIMLNSDDASQYDGNANGLLDGKGVSGFKENPALSNFSPGYSLFLAGLYLVTGRNLTVVLAIQAILSSFVPVVLYHVGRRSCGENAARVGAVLAALSQLLIFNSVNLTREMISLLLVMPVIALLQRAVPGTPRDGIARVLAGILFGMLILVDPVFIFVALAFSMLYVLRGHDRLLRSVVAAGVMWLAIYATVVPLKHLVVSPVTIHDRLSLVTRPSAYAVHVSKDFNPFAKQLYERGINPFAYPMESLRAAAAQPMDTATLELKKVWLDLRRFFFEGNSGLFFPLLLIANTFFSGHIFFYAVLSAAIGTVVTISKMLRATEQAWNLAVAWLSVASYSGIYIILFFGMTRFRATIHPMLLLLIGTGLSATFAWVRTNIRREAA